MVVRQSAAAAFEAHLAALTEALDVQAALVRSALDLQPASSLVGFKTVAEVAIGKFSVAIGDLRSELIVAATVAASSELPEAAAVEAPASKAQPSPGIVAASLAGCVAGMCRERAPQHRSPSGAGLDPKPAPSRRSGRGSHGAADAEAGPASTQAPRRHRSRRPGTGTGQGVVPMQPTPSGEEACADSEGIGSWGSRRSSGGNGQGGVLLHPMPSGEEVRFEGKSIGSGGSCHSGGNGQGGARMQSITSGEEVHFEGKSIGSEVSDLADGHLTMPNERANTARQSCAESAIFLSRSRSGVSQTSPCISGVLNPDWPLRLAWDLAVIFMVICDSVVIPFQLAEFRVEPEFDQFWLWFTVSLFSCDLVMSFFTGYKAGKKDVSLQEGTLVTDKVSIAMHYLRGWFWIDFLSTVPWSVIAKAATSGSEGGSSSAGEVTKLAKVVKLTRLLRLMRMLRLAKLSVIWDRIEGRIGSITALNVVSMLKVLGTWAAICHWGACIWWMVGKRDSLVMLVTMQDAKVGGLHWTEVPRMHSAFDESWTWVERPASEQYVFCFYWILGVMRTMPAEVTPVTLTERVFVLLFMFFAVAAFAVNVTRITQAWFRFGSRRDAFKEEMACFRMHLRTINCGDALQMRTQACLNHLFEKRKIHAKELGLLNALPEGLKSKLSQAHRIHYLRMIPRLHNWIDPALRHVCDATEVLDFLPGDKLTEKDLDAEAAFVLMRGGLQVYDPSAWEPGGRGSKFFRGSSSTTPIFGALTVVDDHCLFERKETARCKDTVMVLECSEVLRIGRKKFQEALQDLRAQGSVRSNSPQERHRATEADSDRNRICFTPPSQSPRITEGNHSQTEDAASRAEEDSTPTGRRRSLTNSVCAGESRENNERVLRRCRAATGAGGQAAFQHAAAASLSVG